MGCWLAESFFGLWFAATGVRQGFINAVPPAAKVLRVDWIYISFPAMKKATAAMPGGFGLVSLVDYFRSSVITRMMR